jgi:hypothetical protein
MKLSSFVTSAGAIALLGGSVLAAPLNLISIPPDAASGGIVVRYDAMTHVFSATGTTQNLIQPVGPDVPLNGRTFSLTATIDNSGNLISGGAASLLVRGDFGGTDQVLFQSNAIIAFGFSAISKFEFLFQQQAGSLAPAGWPIGTILIDTNLSFPGGVPSFQSSFVDEIFPGFGLGQADTFVPAPAGAMALVMGGLVIARRRR